MRFQEYESTDFEEYQASVDMRRLYPGPDTLNGLLYASIALGGEAGELLNKIKKIMRGDKTITESREALIGELGDVLWYAGALAREVGSSLEEVAKYNMKKIESRQERGVIQGDGDNR